jgi:hypothetical protein
MYACQQDGAGRRRNSQGIAGDSCRTHRVARRRDFGRSVASRDRARPRRTNCRSCSARSRRSRPERSIGPKSGSRFAWATSASLSRPDRPPSGAAGETTVFFFSFTTNRQTPTSGFISGRTVSGSGPTRKMGCARGRVRVTLTAEGANGRPPQTDNAPDHGAITLRR